METNLYDRVKSLEAEMNRIIKAVSDVSKKEEPQQTSARLRPIFLENINGLFQTISRTPSYVPRNFKEQFVLVDSGSVTKLYVRFGSSWRLQRFYNT